MPRPYKGSGHRAKSQSVNLLKPVQNGFRRSVHDIEYMIKAFGAAVVRIGHLVIAGLRVELAKETDTRAMIALWIEAERVVQIVAVHCEDVVEPPKIIGFNLPCADTPQIDAAPHRGRAHPCVRLLPDVPSARASGVDFEAIRQSGTFNLLPENALRKRTPANISEANEQNTDGLIGHGLDFVG